MTVPLVLVAAVEPVSLTQWLIAAGSLASALIALALAFGLKEWIFRPRIDLILRNEERQDEISDRVVTKRITTGETAAFVRMRVYNSGRTTARNVGIRLLETHRWDPAAQNWRRARPELDGWLLQPSNQHEAKPDTLDVVPGSDRLIDLASAEYTPGADGTLPFFVEIIQPWPPNQANRLDPGSWQLHLLVCGDNIPARRYHVTLTFDGATTPTDRDTIWDHFIVEGPYLQPAPAPTLPSRETRPTRHDTHSHRRNSSTDVRPPNHPH
jgi:hypothetical protein